MSGSRKRRSKRRTPHWPEDIHAARQRNRTFVERMLWSLRIGFGALILEVILFLTALAIH